MIVMKFGGTSVENEIAIQRVIDIVSKVKSLSPIVVSSATSGTTNKLLESAKFALSGHLQIANELVDEIENRHLEILEKLVKSAFYKDEAKIEILEILAILRANLQKYSVSGEIFYLDDIASAGEMLSTRIITAAMLDQGFKAKFFDIRNIMITDSEYLNAKVDINEFENLTDKILKPLVKEKFIPITQGFLGRDLQGRTTTLGRGGSDYSAALIGAALNAIRIEIWTDVDGIMTADPKVVPNAKTIDSVSFNEAEELAYYGAKVLHPATIAPAIEKNIPVLVLNSKNADAKGTEITNEKNYSDENPVKSIALRKNISLINIRSDLILGPEFLKKVKTTFEKYKLPIDIISTSESSASIIIDAKENLEKIKNELNTFSKINIFTNVSAITVVGHGLSMNNIILSKIMKTVSDLDVIMISEIMSEINLSLIVDTNKTDETIRRLHESFLADNRTR